MKNRFGYGTNRRKFPICKACNKIYPSRKGGAYNKKYCSKKCHYKYHGRRSGLKYKIIKINN